MVKALRQWPMSRNLFWDLFGRAGAGMIRRSDEIFDHKDSLVKTRLLGLWEHQLVIRQAQDNEMVAETILILFCQKGKEKRGDLGGYVCMGNSHLDLVLL